jgi:hypothetical protein
VSARDDQRSILRREYETLVRLHQRLDAELQATVPRPLALTNVCDLTLLLQTPMTGRSLYAELRNAWRPRRLAGKQVRHAREWLVRFQKANLVEQGSLDDETLEQYVMRPIVAFSRQAHPGPSERALLDRTFELARRLRSLPLALVCRHGDYWARNVFAHGGEVGVIDWEHFRSPSAPFTDPFMFISSYGMIYPWQLARWSEPLTAFSQACLAPGWMASMLRRELRAYCSAMHMAPELMKVFYPAFLAERALEEIAIKPAEQNTAEETLWRRLFRAYSEARDLPLFD